MHTHTGRHTAWLFQRCINGAQESREVGRNTFELEMKMCQDMQMAWRQLHSERRKESSLQGALPYFYRSHALSLSPAAHHLLSLAVYKRPMGTRGFRRSQPSWPTPVQCRLCSGTRWPTVSWVWHIQIYWQDARSSQWQYAGSEKNKKTKLTWCKSFFSLFVWNIHLFQAWCESLWAGHSNSCFVVL